LHQRSTRCRATNGRGGIYGALRLRAADAERSSLQQVARIRSGGHDPVLFAAAARSRHDKIRPQQDHCRWHGLAVLQRTQARTEELTMRAAHVLALVVMASVTLMQAPDAPQGAFGEQQLPKIAPAPEFALTSQNGAQVLLADLHGQVVPVTFIYTLCTRTCPVLKPLMSRVTDPLW